MGWRWTPGREVTLALLTAALVLNVLYYYRAILKQSIATTIDHLVLHRPIRFNLTSHTNIPATPGPCLMTSASNTTDAVFLLCPTNHSSRLYAVISASTPSAGSAAYRYVFYLPLTVRAWRRLGFDTAVILVGTLKEWTASPPLLHILRALLEVKAAVAFIDAPLVNRIMLSQTVRLFTHNIFNELSDDVNVITSDADLWPLNKDIYMPAQGIKVIRSTNSYCCGSFEHGRSKVRMLPMATVEMSVQTWRDVMNVYNSTPRTGPQIIHYFYNEFGKLAEQQARVGNSVWYLDQKMISVRINAWARKHGENKVDYVARFSHADRVDRSWWRIPNSLTGINDAHLLVKPFTVSGWRRLRPLLQLMYGLEENRQCDEYAMEFRRLLTQTGHHV